MNYDKNTELMSVEVSVCVCTYHRPAMLNDLLCSLAAQTLDSSRFELVVVDNDPYSSAAETVESFRSENTAVSLRYVVEPKPGVSHARNRAVAVARAPLLAFIDDDETASPDWLERLLLTQARYRADVVLGPTRVRLDSSLPLWLCHLLNKQSQLDDLMTGQSVPQGIGGAGNVLIRRLALGTRVAEPFDRRLTHSGGEDSDLFDWLHQQGGRLIWCAEAHAWEKLAPERYHLRYYVRRSLFSSTVYWREAYRRSCSLSIAGQVCVGLGLALLFGLGALLALPAGRRRWVPLFLTTMRGVGRILALTPLQVRTYGVPPESIPGSTRC